LVGQEKNTRGLDGTKVPRKDRKTGESSSKKGFSKFNSKTGGEGMVLPKRGGKHAIQGTSKNILQFFQH